MITYNGLHFKSIFFLLCVPSLTPHKRGGIGGVMEAGLVPLTALKLSTVQIEPVGGPAVT